MGRDPEKAEICQKWCTLTYEKARGKEGRCDGKSLRLSESFCKANVESSSQNSSQRSPRSHGSGPPIVRSSLGGHKPRGTWCWSKCSVVFRAQKLGHQPILLSIVGYLRGTFSWLHTSSPQRFGEQFLQDSQGPLFLRKSQWNTLQPSWLLLIYNWCSHSAFSIVNSPRCHLSSWLILVASLVVWPTESLFLKSLVITLLVITSSQTGVVTCVYSRWDREMPNCITKIPHLFPPSLFPLCESGLIFCWSRSITCADMVNPALQAGAWTQGLQNVLVTAIAYSSVGSLLCPLARVHLLGGSGPQLCKA